MLTESKLWCASRRLGGWPRHFRMLALVGVMTGLWGCAQAEAPGVALADGSNIDLAAGEHWLVVNYWAEWCGPCRHEIPELNSLDRREGGLPVRVLGVNYDGLSQPQLGEVIERMGITFPVLLADPRAPVAAAVANGAA